MNQNDERKVSEMDNVRENSTVDQAAELEKQLRSLTSEDRKNLIRFLRELAAQDE